MLQINIASAIPLSLSQKKELESSLEKKYNKEELQEIKNLMGVDTLAWKAETDSILIKTLEGNMEANKNDYIIKGVKGEFYPCKPDIFEMTYEPVGEVKDIY